MRSPWALRISILTHTQPPHPAPLGWTSCAARHQQCDGDAGTVGNNKVALNTAQVKITSITDTWDNATFVGADVCAAHTCLSEPLTNLNKLCSWTSTMWCWCWIADPFCNIYTFHTATAEYYIDHCQLRQCNIVSVWDQFELERSPHTSVWSSVTLCDVNGGS